MYRHILFKNIFNHVLDSNTKLLFGYFEIQYTIYCKASRDNTLERAGESLVDGRLLLTSHRKVSHFEGILHLVVILSEGGNVKNKSRSKINCDRCRRNQCLCLRALKRLQKVMRHFLLLGKVSSQPVSRHKHSFLCTLPTPRLILQVSSSTTVNQIAKLGTQEAQLLG